MTLGERAYEIAVASGTLAFGDLSKPWAYLDEATRAKWETNGRMADKASRADVVSQLHDIASRLDRDDGHDCAVRDAADRVEAGR